MAKVTITIEDTDDEMVHISYHCNPPLPDDEEDFTEAQWYLMGIDNFIEETDEGNEVEGAYLN